MPNRLEVVRRAGAGDYSRIVLNGQDVTERVERLAVRSEREAVIAWKDGRTKRYTLIVYSEEEQP